MDKPGINKFVAEALVPMIGKAVEMGASPVDVLGGIFVTGALVGIRVGLSEDEFIAFARQAYQTARA